MFVTGPMFQPQPSGSLAFLLAILKGERLQKVNKGAMSVRDVRDLAALEIAALTNPDAKGILRVLCFSASFFQSFSLVFVFVSLTLQSLSRRSTRLHFRARFVRRFVISVEEH